MLQFAREREVLLQSAFLADDLLIEACVLDRDGYLAGEGGQRTLMFLREVSTAGVLEIEDTDYLSLVDKGDHQFGAGLGISRDIAHIFFHISDQNRFIVLGGIAYKSAAEWDVVLQMDVLPKAYGEAVLQFFACRIDKQDREHLVIDNAGEQVPDALKQLVEVEDGGELAADLVEQQQRFRLVGDASVKPGVLDADGDARCDDREQATMFFGEVVRLRRLNIDDPDDLVFRDHRDGQFGADGTDGVDVLRLL